MSIIGVSPAFGRTYKSKREVLTAWLENKDFICTDLLADGRHVAKSDLDAPRYAGVEWVNVRQGARLTVLRRHAQKGWVAV